MDLDSLGLTKVQQFVGLLGLEHKASTAKLKWRI